MSTMVVELYEALTKAGVDEETAKEALGSGLWFMVSISVIF